MSIFTKCAIASLGIFLLSFILFFIARATQKRLTTGQGKLNNISKKADSEKTADDIAFERRAHAFFKERLEKHFLFKPKHCLLLGFIAAMMVYLYPIVLATPELSSGHNVVSNFFIVAHNVLKLFVVDADFAFITAQNEFITSELERNVFTLAGCVYYIGAPVFTAVSLLSFVKDFFSMRIIKLHKIRPVYIFSSLNELTVALAKDIVEKREKGKKATLVFTDVYETDDDNKRELEIIAQRLGAICVSKNITELKVRWFRWNSETKYYFMDNESFDENMKQALKIIDRLNYMNERKPWLLTRLVLWATSKTRYKRQLPEVYVYSSSAESEALIDSVDKTSLRVRRINENRNLVFKTMREHSVYEDAKNSAVVNGEKQMNVAIVGLGGYGRELLKTLTWLGQAKGYYLNAYVFDGERGEEKIKAIAPEIIKYNVLDPNDEGAQEKAQCGYGTLGRIEGETRYSIKFFDEIDVNTTDFLQQISSIEGLTSIYVTLGDDSLNVQTALNIRREIGRAYVGATPPAIYAIVFNSLKTEVLRLAEQDRHKITFIGNIEQAFSKETIEQRATEEKGFSYHSCWADNNNPAELAREQERFNSTEYFRRSSMAQALFYDLEGGQSEFESLMELAEYEHARWNAFMRAEGYVLGKDEAEKDLFVKKVHRDLRPFDKLSFDDKRKDYAFIRANTDVKIKDRTEKVPSGENA